VLHRRRRASRGHPRLGYLSDTKPGDPRHYVTTAREVTDDPTAVCPYNVRRNTPYTNIVMPVTNMQFQWPADPADSTLLERLSGSGIWTIRRSGRYPREMRVKKTLFAALLSSMAVISVGAQTPVNISTESHDNREVRVETGELPAAERCEVLANPSRNGNLVRHGLK
jgi:hypothetical protein